ncbi:MAG: carboxypeptidase-like regulatory domain-containing protein, partial [Thermoplasmata archaeon]
MSEDKKTDEKNNAQNLKNQNNSQQSQHSQSTTQAKDPQAQSHSQLSGTRAQNQAQDRSYYDAYYYQYPRYYYPYHQHYYPQGYPCLPYPSQQIPPYIPPHKKTSKKPIIAGALLIIAGIVIILFSSIIFVSGAFFWNANEDDNYWQNWQSSDLVNIIGTVSNSEGLPLDNVTVSITGTHLYSITNSTGQYKLSGVPCGYREIKLEKDGFHTIIYRTQLKEQDFDNNPYYNENLTQTNALVFDFTMTPGDDTVTYGPSMHEPNSSWNRVSIWFAVCGTFTMLSGIFSTIGGFYSMQRKHFGLALSGAILGIFGFGFALGTILAIIALFILLLSSDEFASDKNKDDGGEQKPKTQPPPERSPSSFSQEKKTTISNEKTKPHKK